MLKIRLQRVGRKNFPSFRVVLAEHTRPVKGKFLEVLGFYNPILKKTGLKKDRIKYWLEKGVQLSPTIHNLFVKEAIITANKIRSWKPKKKTQDTKEEKLAEKPEAIEKSHEKAAEPKPESSLQTIDNK